jgi:hypothetical protein
LNLATLPAERIIVLDGGRIDGDGGTTPRHAASAFSIATTVNGAPGSGIPFILPQGMAAAKCFAFSDHLRHHLVLRAALNYSPSQARNRAECRRGR